MTTGALDSEIRSTGGWVGDIDVSKSFAATWDRCQNPAICAVVESDPANLEARQRLVQAIELRARAVEAIGKAYEALAKEAAYDARADLEGAVGDAVSAANAYSGFLLPPGAQLIGAQAAQVTGLVAGLLAERSQRKRLLTGSQAIGRSLATLRQGLQAERDIYGSIQTYVADSRTDARLALYQSGLVSRVEFLKPLAAQLGVSLLGTADATLGTSVPARTAVEATIKAQGRAEARKVQAHYDASLAALDALQRTHADFEQKRPVSIADVARFLAELDAALTEPAKEEDGK